MENPEYDEVEQPLIAQLRAMGWEHLHGAPTGGIPRDPKASGRESFRETFLLDRLRAALLRVNRTPAGEEWLDHERQNHAVGELTRRTEPHLVEANEATTTLLLEGTTVAGLPDWDGGRNQRIHYIDWDNLQNNDFLVVSQFRVDRPGGAGRPYVVPDLVLFVNGIPLAVIECKRRDRDAISEAVNQLLGYAGRLEGYAAHEIRELFHPVQLLVATQYDRARLGTITSDPEHFAEWKDVHPLTDAQVLAELGRTDGELSGQEKLTAGVLRPERLLDIVRHFTLSMTANRRRVKVVARYQQYRAVRKITARLRSRGTSAQSAGGMDPRGGYVWHTQGSGKSLTMTFLVRAMRSDPFLRRFKVVVVTDRTDLQEQLDSVMRLTGESVQPAKTSAAMQGLIAEEGPGLVFGMIQKYRRDDQDAGGADPSPDQGFEDDPAGTQVHFPELNTSPEILVLIDEAHRSHTSTLHARLQRAMPNAVRIGFTGTPIVSRGKTPTTQIFGERIDTYTIHHAERDGAIVPIRYELREPQREVGDPERLDAAFEGLFDDETPAQRQEVQRKYTSARQVRESWGFIRVNARDVLEHYVDTVLPDRFKAQLTAVSRLAVVRYREALLLARDELVAELDALDLSLAYTPWSEIEDERTSFLVRAWRHRDLLRVLDFVPVISGGVVRDPRTREQRPDPAEWELWTDKQRHKDYISRFRQPFPRISTDPWDEHGEDEDPGEGRGGRGSDAGGTAGGASVAAGTAAGRDPWASPGSAPATSSGQASSQAGGEQTATQQPVDGPVAFLIVQSMLLTGFDAPIEQVLYSDRPIKQEELLQAVARPNRPAHNKEAGYFVDYAGVADNLAAALSAYDMDDVDDALKDLSVEIGKLRPQRDRLVGYLAGHGIDDLTTEAGREACVQLLADDRIRGHFDALLRQFLRTLDIVLPRPESLEFGDDAKRFLLVQYLARRRYRDQREGGFDASLYGAKVRQLLDEHLRATGIEQRIPPVSITAEDFLERVQALADPRARAAEMEHALRLHLDQHFDEDPVRYRKLSERLDEVLAALDDQAELLVLQLRDLIEEALAPRPDDGLGLDPRLERPLLDVLFEARKEADGAAPVAPESLVPLTREFADRIAYHAGIVRFAENFAEQERLRKWLYNRLVNENVCDLDQATAVADKLMQMVRARLGQYARWRRPDAG